MEKFTSKWNPPYEPSTSDKMSEALSNPGPLKPRLGEGTRLLATQKKKLDGILSKMAYKDKKLLSEVAAAKQSGNMYQARTLAAELVQSRATQQMIANVRIMIDKTEHRFVTYDGIGDVAVTVEPIISLMNNLKSSLNGFLPNTASEISGMTDMLSNYTSQTADHMEFNMDMNTMRADVDDIMSQAAAVASDSLNATLPSTPTEIDNISTSNNTI